MLTLATRTHPRRAATRPTSTKRRCAWARGEMMARYHDEEWGVPVRDDVALFELLTLEGAQAGLSWSTVLAKREAYRKAFDRFDPEAVSRYTERDVRQLLENDGIVRHRAKIAATITNARAVLDVQRTHGSFATLIWSFVDGRPIQNARQCEPQDVAGLGPRRPRRAKEKSRRPPAETDISRAMSRALRARGVRFVGPTICYAFMQAAGLVNDHTVDCFRWREIRNHSRQ